MFTMHYSSLISFKKYPLVIKGVSYDNILEKLEKPDDWKVPKLVGIFTDGDGFGFPMITFWQNWKTHKICKIWWLKSPQISWKEIRNFLQMGNKKVFYYSEIVLNIKWFIHKQFFYYLKTILSTQNILSSVKGGPIFIFSKDSSWQSREFWLRTEITWVSNSFTYWRTRKVYCWLSWWW